MAPYPVAEAAGGLRQAPTRARLAPSAPHPAAVAAGTAGGWRFWKGVDFDLGFVAFCAYVVSVITYVAPIGDIAMAAAVVGVLIAGRFRVPAPLVLYAGFILWSLFSYLKSPFPAESWLQLDKDFKLLVIVAVGLNVLTNTARVRFFTLVVLAAFGAYPVRGAIFNYFIHGSAVQDRVAWNNAFSNPNDLAAFLLIPLALSAAVLHTERHKLIRLAALGGTVIIPLVVFLSGSRGAMLGLVCFAVVALLAQKRHRGRLIGAAVITLIVLGALAPKSAWERLLSMASADTENLQGLNDSGSARQRFEIWKVARAIAGDNPVFGVGTGAYRFVHQRYVKLQIRKFDRFAGGHRDPHSTYLGVAAETGIPGAALFFGVFLSAAAFLRRTQRRIAAAFPARAAYLRFITTGLAAFAVAGIFGTYMHVSFGFLLVVVMWSTAKAFEQDFVRSHRQVA